MMMRVTMGHDEQEDVMMIMCDRDAQEWPETTHGSLAASAGANKTNETPPG